MAFFVVEGEELCRIGDDSEECLIDIVSMDERVYILDETVKTPVVIITDEHETKVTEL